MTSAGPMHGSGLLLLIVLLLGGCAAKHPRINEDSAGIFSIYGNWCGPDHPKVMEPPPEAIDRVDASCMRHDYCYVERGYLDCQCDEVLMREIEQDQAEGNYGSDVERRYARSIHTYFKGSPCNANGDGNDHAKLAPTRGLNRIIEKSRAGINSMVERISGDVNAD